MCCRDESFLLLILILLLLVLSSPIKSRSKSASKSKKFFSQVGEIGYPDRFMESLLDFCAVHWDHEPTPDPSQEGNGPKRVLPPWEGSGVGWFMERS